MNNIKKNLPLIAVLAMAVLMLLPFLGLTEFNTKGEPREAVVALSMLKDGDWILPVNNGVDIPYKPPFFHYCIAVVSLLTGGVDEYTSRLPSALSLIALVVGCFAFYRRRVSTLVAFSAAVLTLTAFEVHRAGANCRVDMLLTAFTVGAMLLLYRWWERGSRGIPVMAVLCMSGAVLTKGPVGFVVPCFVMGVFTLLRGGKFWRTFLGYAAIALLSCVLPALWYVAAWHEGGQHFLDLVYEENIGRMTGTMSYDSHVHSFPYNFFTLFTGWAPWTLLLVFSLLSKPWNGLRCRRTEWLGGAAGGWKARLSRLRIRIMQVPPVQLFTWLGFLLVLFFYCLPSSKRSVYLLPCYPFMAVLIAQYIDWLWRTRRRGALRAYTLTIVGLAVVLTVAFIAVRAGVVPDSLFHGKHAPENIAMLHALRDTPLDIWTLIVVALPLVASVNVVRDMLNRDSRGNKRLAFYDLFAPLVMIFIALDGFYQPVVLNTKSLRPMVEYLKTAFPGEPYYQYVNDRMMHFFGADFYLGDNLTQFELPVRTTAADGTVSTTVRTPERGVLVVPEGDFASLAERHPDYRFTLVHTSTRYVAEMKQYISFYRFERLSGALAP